MKYSFLRKCMGLLLMLMISLCVNAQVKVSGTVTDGSGEALVGVSVVQAGVAKNGTVTDVNGKYSLTVPENARLNFSFVGYTPFTVGVNGKTTLNVVLHEDAQGLDELVVVGYGTMKKSDLSGSVATVNKEQMERKVPTNIAQALQGAAAGVMVTAQDGAPGAKSAIRIRGIGTINGDAQPLYVVDGVQVGNNADFVNPADIESIEVLKDASATAIYGSAGANGVIMVTTKHGQKGKMNINITADFGFQTLPYKINTLKGDAYAESIRTARANDGASPTNLVFLKDYDGKRNLIDWQDQMTHTGLKQQYGISASGGTDKTQYNFSIGYLNNEGIIVNTNYDRLTARAGVKSKVNKYLEFGGDMSYMYSTVKGNNIGLGNNGNLSSHRDLAQMAPTLDYIAGNVAGGKLVNVNVVNPDGTYGATVASNPNGWDGMNDVAAQNPYATQMEIGRTTMSSRVSINPYADLTLLKTKEHSLNVHTILNWTHESSANDEFSGKYERYNYINGVRTPISYIGRDQEYYSFGLGQSYGLTKGIETYMTYKWETDFNALTVMAGNSVSKYEGRWVSASTNKFLSADHRLISLSEGEKNGNGGYNPDVTSISYYGRLVYSLFDRYILTATLRRDGSSNFSSSNRWGTFPSAAIAWRLKEESFLKNVDAITNAKLRLGWGQTGNPGGVGGKSKYILSTVDTKYQYYGTNGGGITGSFDRVTGSYFPLVDTSLKWETNEQTNIGLDLGFLGGDLGITMDYFIRKTKDLLIDKQIRPSSGYQSVYTNFGEIDNKGFEFSVNYTKHINKDWTVNAAFNGSTLTNKIKKMGVDYTSTLDGGNSTYSADGFDGSNTGAVDKVGFKWDGHSICREGYAVGSYYGWRVDRIIKTQADLDEVHNRKGVDSNGNPVVADSQPGAVIGDYMYKDLNGDGIIDDGDRDIIGNGLPSFNFGLNLSASYKNWDFSIYTYGVLGMDILSYSAMRYANINPSDDVSTPALLKESYDKIWSPTNPNGTYARLTRNDENKNSRVSDAWIENGNFLKISNIQIGYNVPKYLLNKIGVTSLRAYVAIQNLCTISPYTKYGDPEVGSGSVLYSGLDTGRYANPRTYQLGINVTF